jgi:uncharacterized protein (TIRG00374 family)
MIRKYIKFILLSLIAVLILWYFGRSLDWTEVARSLKQANPLLLLISVLIICFGYLLRAFRWRTLLKPLAESNLATLFEATTVGYAALFLFGRAGEVVRPLWLPARDRRIRPTAALVTIGVERFCDLVAIVVLFAINLIWFKVPQGRESEFAFVNRSGLLLLLATVVGILCLALFQKRSKFFIKWIDRIFLGHRFVPRRIALQIHKLLNHLVISLGILFDVRELPLCIFWTGLLWFAISIPTWLVIVAVGLPLDFSDALFVMGWAVVGSLVPTPGGAAGAFHTATAGSLIFLGIGAEAAAATSIILHFVYFAPALLFGVYYFVRGEVTLSGIRTMVLGGAEDQESIKPDNVKSSYGNQVPETGR